MPVTTKAVARGKEWEKETKEETLVDFGFTIGNDNQTIDGSATIASLQKELKLVNMKLEFLKNRMFTMLDNFAKHPEIPTIQWPNRLEHINKVKDEITKKLAEK
jgi:hypothetical protein